MRTYIYMLQMMGQLAHQNPVRALTCIKTMNGLVFVTNSGTDMKSYMNVWNVQGLGNYINRRKLVNTHCICSILYLCITADCSCLPICYLTANGGGHVPESLSFW